MRELGRARALGRDGLAVQFHDDVINITTLINNLGPRQDDLIPTTSPDEGGIFLGRMGGRRPGVGETR